MSTLRNRLAFAVLTAALGCAHALEIPGAANAAMERMAQPPAPDLAAYAAAVGDAAQAAVAVAVSAGTEVSPADAPAAQEVAAELERGVASWYGPGFHGRRTASGEVFNMDALTAAHPNLPFGSLVRVKNEDSGRSVDVRINDRGPHIARRVIDLSRGAARALGLLEAGQGLKRVTLTLLDAAGAQLEKIKPKTPSRNGRSAR